MGLTGGVKSHRLSGQISPYCEKKRHWLCAYCAPMFNRRSRVRAVVSRASTGLVGQNTSCKAHKVCISLWPTGWDDVFCS